MLYVHSSKAEELDLKTIARNFISVNTCRLQANCNCVIFCFLHELLQFVMLMKLCSFRASYGIHLCHGSHVLLVPPHNKTSYTHLYVDAEEYKDELSPTQSFVYPISECSGLQRYPSCIHLSMKFNMLYHNRYRKIPKVVTGLLQCFTPFQ